MPTASAASEPNPRFKRPRVFNEFSRRFFAHHRIFFCLPRPASFCGQRPSCEDSRPPSGALKQGKGSLDSFHCWETLAVVALVFGEKRRKKMAVGRCDTATPRGGVGVSVILFVQIVAFSMMFLPREDPDVPSGFQTTTLQSRECFRLPTTSRAINLPNATSRWSSCATFECSRVGRCDPERYKNKTRFWLQQTFIRGDVHSRAASVPCCVHMMRDMAIQVGCVFKQLEIPYFAHYGFLLGLLRGDGIISFTSDIDIAMPEEFYAVAFGGESTKARRALFDAGFVGFDQRGIMGRICFAPHYAGGVLKAYPYRGGKFSYADTFPYMDVYRELDEPAGVRFPWGTCSPFKREWVLPFGTKNATTQKSIHSCCSPTEIQAEHRKLGDLSSGLPSCTEVHSPEIGACVPLPRDPVMILNHNYGPNWRIPISTHASHGSHDDFASNACGRERRILALSILELVF
jgi:hypothetical protein